MLVRHAGRLNAAQARSMCGLPYRIRAPLAKLKESKKHMEGEAAAAPAGGLGDGEKLETNETGPDYVGLALRSRVYDMVHETPLQFASGLSAKLNAMVHLKREDLLPSFSYKLRGAYNLLATRTAEDGKNEVITYSVGSQGHSLSIAASAGSILVLPAVATRRRDTCIAPPGLVGFRASWLLAPLRS